MKVLNFPLTKITISFITGIIISYYFQPKILIVISALTVTTILFLITFFSYKKTKSYLVYSPVAFLFLLGL